MDKRGMAQVIDNLKDRLTQASDRIWDFAETAFQEFRSAGELMSLLEELEFSVEKNVAGIETAFCGSWGEGKPVIAFLGEFDALSGLDQLSGIDHKESLYPGGNGHGCGHNLLGVGALGAAAALKEYLKANGLSGTVRYYGCPGEEGGSGKAFMAKAGVFDGVDGAITWHPGTTCSVLTQSSLANYQVAYRFKGISAHAAAAPHMGRSALDAVELMNIGVQFLREHIVSEARIHYAITDTGGVSPNVVQPMAEVLYLIRAPRTPQVQEIFERVNKIAQGAALMTETELEIDFVKACANLVPNCALEQALHHNLAAFGVPAYNEEDWDLAKKLFETVPPQERSRDLIKMSSGAGEAGLKFVERQKHNALVTEVTPYGHSGTCMAGSTDVGDVSWNVPTVQLWMGTWPSGTPGHSWQVVTVGKSHMAHEGMLQAAKIMAATGADLIENPELLSRAWEELRVRLNGEKYHCAIPDGVKPRTMGGKQN